MTLAVGLFHNTNNLLNVITDICTSETCLSMNGPNGEFFVCFLIPTWCETSNMNLSSTSNLLECVFNWQDDRGKNMRVSAPQYYDFAMTWCQQRLTNQDIFPTKFGDQFPDDYMMYIKRIMSVLWAVICHIYHVHWIQIKGMVKLEVCNSLLTNKLKFLTVKKN